MGQKKTFSLYARARGRNGFYLSHLSHACTTPGQPTARLFLPLAENGAGLRDLGINVVVTDTYMV